MPSQRIQIGLVGPSSHTIQDHQSARTLNMYPEVNDADAKAPVALHSCPGLDLYADVSDYVLGAQIRGMHRMGERLFIQAANAITEVRGQIDFYQYASLSTFKGRVGMSDNAGKVIVGDGTGFYVLDPNTPFTAPPVLSSGDQILGTFSGFIDSRTIYVERDTGKFYYSALNDPTTVDGLNFATAEGDPDPIIALVIANREMIFLGPHSVEYWAPTGDADNPFQRISGGFSAHGCAARWSAQLFENSAVFVGQSDDGHGFVWRCGAAGSPPQRISSHAVDHDLTAALKNYDHELITAYTYVERGHAFYVLNLPNGKTWAYDSITGLWHERAHLNPHTGLFERGRPDVHAFWQGVHYVGVYDDAALYVQSRAIYANGGTPLVRLRETPHIHAQGRWMRFNSLTVDMEVGVGLDGAGQGGDPQLMLQYSDDGGHTWSNEITRSIGRIGATKTQVRFGPLGRSRDRVFRLSVSDPVPVTFVNAWADVDIAA
jgi:hypothetical protein